MKEIIIKYEETETGTYYEADLPPRLERMIAEGYIQRLIAQDNAISER